MVKSEKGQSLVEFALVLPLLLILICATFDFGRVMYTYMHLNLIAQESVRMGGLGESDLGITTFAQDNLRIGDVDLLQIQISPNESQRQSGDYVTVTLQYPVAYVTPFLATLFPSPYQVIINSTIRVE
ncbi:MAG: pilus assembly protein [Anaeromicrobium sp.]|jgi:Flp pilus assembly protein TadG|uniref:TadE/TadG family type IV pilus assembly protein n=1 Tax=Anaeromicrobium sp. TaxID=1929132 RepID=UPI0025D5F599|nr:TadE/TadG family type IV pilus assembly protein [Anaeromicrobium sp.]MCT4595107.1 pilus assembly protein [Anaeromicrobium sp.]